MNQEIYNLRMLLITKAQDGDIYSIEISKNHFLVFIKEESIPIIIFTDGRANKEEYIKTLRFIAKGVS